MKRSFVDRRASSQSDLVAHHCSKTHKTIPLTQLQRDLETSPICEHVGLISRRELFRSVLSFGRAHQARVIRGSTSSHDGSVQCQTLLRLCTHPKPKQRKFGR